MENQQQQEQALKFFKQEELDWQLVNQAANNGDTDAMLAMALVRPIGDELEILWREHGALRSIENNANTADPDQSDAFTKINARIGYLVTRRVEILYYEYRIQDKRLQIYRDTIGFQMKGIPLENVINN
jgi:hypothetical protein